LTKKDRNSGMGGLFDIIEDHKKTVDQIHLEPVPEYAENELLKMEKENLGLYISSHPLAKFEKKIAAYSTHSSQLLKDLKTAVDEGDEAGLAIPDRVTLGGILISLSTKYTKNNDLMALCVLEDLESEIKVIFFPKTYQKFMAEIKIDAPLLLSGRLDMNGKEVQVVVESVELLANLKEAKPKPNIINIKIDEQELHEEQMQYLRQILSGNKGSDPVVFHLFDLDKNEKVNIKVGKEFYISTNEQLLEKIRKITCVEDVWVNGQI
jgi:DNA polymerase-3 subunit alpha